MNFTGYSVFRDERARKREVIVSIFEILVICGFFMLIYGVFKLIDEVRGLRKQVAELSNRIAPYDMPEEIFMKARDFNINDLGRSLERMQSDLSQIEMHTNPELRKD